MKHTKPTTKTTVYGIIGNGRAAKNIARYFSLLKIPYNQWHRKSIKTLEKSIGTGCISILNMFRELFEKYDDNPTRLYIVTSGATHIGDIKNLSLAKAPVWGLARTIMHEYQHVGTTLIDISNDITKEELIHAKRL